MITTSSESSISGSSHIPLMARRGYLSTFESVRVNRSIAQSENYWWWIASVRPDGIYGDVSYLEWSLCKYRFPFGSRSVPTSLRVALIHQSSNEATFRNFLPTFLTNHRHMAVITRQKQTTIAIASGKLHLVWLADSIENVTANRRNFIWAN